MPDPRRILLDAGLDPVTVAGECGVLDLGAVVIRPVPRGMRMLWLGGVSAMTLRDRIFLEPSVLAADPERLGALVVHELAHVGQWRRLGPVRFLARYLGGYLAGRVRGRAHRDAYRGIALERAANDVVRRVTGR